MQVNILKRKSFGFGTRDNSVSKGGVFCGKFVISGQISKTKIGKTLLTDSPNQTGYYLTQVVGVAIALFFFHLCIGAQTINQSCPNYSSRPLCSLSDLVSARKKQVQPNW